MLIDWLESLGDTRMIIDAQLIILKSFYVLLITCRTWRKLDKRLVKLYTLR